MKKIGATLLLEIVLISCNAPLTEKERSLTGCWKHAINTTENSDSTYGYLELGPDRKGITGVVGNINGSITHMPYLSYPITNWEVRNDTLIVDYTMNGGKVSIPTRKDTLIEDFGVTDYWIIKELKESEFVAEHYTPIIDFPFTKHFTRTEKIE